MFAVVLRGRAGRVFFSVMRGIAIADGAMIGCGWGGLGDLDEVLFLIRFVGTVGSPLQFGRGGRCKISETRSRAEKARHTFVGGVHRVAP